jgi:hypothetical protein
MLNILFMHRKAGIHGLKQKQLQRVSSAHSGDLSEGGREASNTAAGRNPKAATETEG